ncbi:hypothetical protein [Salipiger mangrovisoli]|uniref:Peptidase inhibitor I78 family protein n=1 Tax=Salipiger mangrovisoli TaxID=2865933 RepID=A0ABR9X4W1_9RHOB|nr:hypothetical protein [Salipiger mangrovisoli]MBE9638482.1 hypothetical protein [Salipiger mangrovisoli]
MTGFHRLPTAALGLSVLAALAACGGKEEPAANMRPATEAEAACLRDVATTAGTKELELTGSEFSEAGTMVTVRVGPERTQWSCIAYADGTTAEVKPDA